MSDARQPLLLAYLGSWGNWQPETIDAAKLTHLCYAFAHVKDGRVAPSGDADALVRLSWVRRLKALHPQLKVLISVGGWGAEGFSDAALTPESRALP